MVVEILSLMDGSFTKTGVTGSNDPNNNDWPRWTLKTNPNEKMFADMFPANRPTSKNIMLLMTKIRQKNGLDVRGSKNTILQEDYTA